MKGRRGEIYVAPSAAPTLAEEDADFEMTPALSKFAEEVSQKALAAQWKEVPGSAALESPLQLLFAILLERYENKLDILLQRAAVAGENVRFSQAAQTVFARRGWRVATARKYATTLKRIMTLMAFPYGFVDSLRLVQLNKAVVCNKAIGKYGSLPLEDPVRMRVESWAQILRNQTRNSSDLSLRNIIGFYTTICLPALKLDLERWPQDVQNHVQQICNDAPYAIQQIIGTGPSATLKSNRLRFFLADVLGVQGIDIPKPPKQTAAAAADDDDDGRDLHRISSEDLELIHKEAAKNPLDALLFMLMITTGLRVGGVAKILIRNVADVKIGKYIVKPDGKTKEKGNKFARFALCPKVRDLMQAWLANHRPADDGPYLFPSAAQGGHASTDTLRARFQRLCRNAGLQGREFHPHALRHTNAHILLECGNSVESVSKCLNHASTAVTEKFYLQESAAEVQKRCNLPWFKAETESEQRKRAFDALPGFLKSDGSAPSSSSTDPDALARKRQRRELRKTVLRDFVSGSAPSASAP